MEHLLYPEKVPTECIAKIIKLVTSGQAISQYPTLLKEIWIVQGYLQGIIAGDPDQPTIMFTAGPNEEEEFVRKELNDLRLALKPAVGGPLANVALRILAQQILALLMEKLNEWLAEYLES